jgi:hypothetical protein
MTTFLFFFACAIAQPSSCQEVQLAAPDMVACRIEGQRQMALWLSDHPGHYLPDGRYVCASDQGEQA